MRKRRRLHIVFALVSASLMLIRCDSSKAPELEGPAPELATIDSLMWQQPDSAFTVILDFAGSSAADSLDVFNGHYCQLLIAELLFKNDYAQTNRTELL